MLIILRFEKQCADLEMLPTLRKKQGMMMKSEAGAEAIDLATTRRVDEEEKQS